MQIKHLCTLQLRYFSNESNKCLEQVDFKCNALDKSKSRLQNDIKEVSVDLDKALARISTMEKKQRIRLPTTGYLICYPEIQDLNNDMIHIT